ncbi:polysaccharide deacetylase family protein [Paenibacillus aurantius]|uniref:Polysaccharide deacetylase family protein n=1 Tax=Paenibacillus aurantius TaxID=2918900 RepID=A0AA96RG09_9BACL|nr:polysaccharide deacetylase family protein [Paenibacillus aurantius]WNQ13975.1 polysaccharide deacetylase family protein [Paenibacillus aurantius]
MKLRCIALCVVGLCISSGCSQNNLQRAQQSTPQSLSEQTKIRVESLTPNLAGGLEQNIRKPHPMTLADLRNKYRSTFLLNGPGTKREVALTFDDAPDANFTPQILDVLKRKGVKATFFVVGNRVLAHPDIVKRMVQEGHTIGNHSYNHANLPKLTDAEFRDQITKTDELIRQYTGFTPNIVRPPYGNIAEEQIQWLASQHKKIVNWNVDSLDWKGLSAKQVETNVLAHVHPGSIVLEHAAGGTGEDLSGTVLALPKIIDELRNDGVKLVTIPELLDIPTK